MPFKQIFRSAAALALALSIAMTLGACQTSGSGINRDLPPLPAYVRRVDTPDPRAGESAITVAARERMGRVRANCIIDNVTIWYGEVRKAHAGQVSPKDMEKAAAAKCSAPNKTSR